MPRWIRKTEDHEGAIEGTEGSGGSLLSDVEWPRNGRDFSEGQVGMGRLGNVVAV